MVVLNELVTAARNGGDALYSLLFLYGENPSLGRKVHQLSELIESVINVG